MRYLLCYDIPVSKRRQRVARLLEDAGHRVQWSVFECDLDPRGKDLLLGALAERMDPTEDRLYLYPLCRLCQSGIERFGTEESPGVDENCWIL